MASPDLFNYAALYQKVYRKKMITILEKFRNYLEFKGFF